MIRANYVKAKFDDTELKNSKGRLHDERDETVNHIIRIFSKLAVKEYKTRHDWVEKEIQWELYKLVKFDYADKWYRH